MNNMLLAQQKQDEYIKQLASKPDVLTTHNKMLEAQIAQQVASSSTPLGRLPGKLKSNPQSTVITTPSKEGVEDPEDISLEEGREVIMTERKERNDGGKPVTFIDDDSFEIPIVFPPKLPDPGRFSIPSVIGKMKIERALCDLCASVSLMAYSMVHKLHLRPL